MRKRELKRQVFHAALGTTIAVLYAFDILPLYLFGIIILTGAIMSYAWTRNAEPIIAWFLHNFERNKQQPGWGALWLCIGCFLSMFLFEKSIALAAMVILALGDSISHYIGRFYGKIKHPWNKKYNVEGTLAAIIVSTLAASITVSILHAFIAAAIAMNLEVIDWGIGKYTINDNLIVPLIAGITLQLLTLL